jgi:xanthine dehydrogenase YagT iron-sulfur-binding subunit
MHITLDVNGITRRLDIETTATLLEVLRDNLGLTGTKRGCETGACGACTVLIDGRRANACLALAAATDGKTVETIEGLGPDLHPVQSAFIRYDAFQCGFCTPGQIMSAIGLMAESGPSSASDIRERMSGNLCRCGAYPNIVAAIQETLTRLTR